MAREKPQPELRHLPMMPIRDVVIFPHQMTPFVVGRQSSVRALEAALLEEKKIFLATQHDAAVDEPTPQQIYTVGTIANIVQSVRLPDGNVRVLVEGIERGRLSEVNETEGFFRAQVRVASTRPEPVTPALEQLMRKVSGLFEQFVKQSQTLNYEAMLNAVRSDDPGQMSDTISAHLTLGVSDKQPLLELSEPAERLIRLSELLEVEIEKLNVDRAIQNRVKRQMEKAQREYYLGEKIKAIQKELGRGEKSEFDEIKKKIEAAGLPAAVKEKAHAELKRLELMPPMSAESTVSRNYLEWMLAVPWKKRSQEIRDITAAEKTLNEDHYGLEKIKERILEFLAVRQLVKHPKGSILCFVGPPGVGKTSLGMSIARATGRKFVRLSLGGVRDEAEIRGHRRTYIGALPGQILQMMKKAGTINPVFLLDEIDKMSVDFRGDPSAALLEVLDPEQNTAFNDHYLDVDYDLSQVMFITTANVMHTIPQPLQDRMEIIRLSGYTEMEKSEIARRFLIPKQIKAAGLTEKNLSFTPEGLQAVIEGYTREAGVRNLEREIGNIGRKVARRVVQASLVANAPSPAVSPEASVGATNGAAGKAAVRRAARSGKKSAVAVEVTPENVGEFLGILRYRDTRGEEKNEIGLATGLAWTEVGGQMLSTEVTLMDGKGKLTLTGKLGDVMQESAQAAMSYIRSRAHLLGLPKDFYRNLDIHIHVPEGAIPKDGPSAGITMATALTSALTRIAVRSDVAMTGEITLRGKVLPIGGVKEKLMAAHRHGITTIILPRDNEKDLADLPDNIRALLEIHPVETMDQVLETALERPIPKLAVPEGAAETAAGELLHQ